MGLGVIGGVDGGIESKRVLLAGKGSPGFLAMDIYRWISPTFKSSPSGTMAASSASLYASVGAFSFVSDF